MAPTFMPSLSAILFAAERSAGRPLRREELEMVVDGAVCMTLDVARALQLERARGYADIEPRLAWEQWQIARQTY